MRRLPIVDENGTLVGIVSPDDVYVGALVVVEERSGRRFSTGLITDRDLVVEALAADAPPEALTAGDIRAAEVLSVGESENVFDTLELMRRMRGNL